MPLHIFKWIHGMQITQAIAGWFHNIKNNADKVAISITEAVKSALDGGFVKTLISFIDDHFKTHVGETVANALKAGTMKLLAIELAVQSLPDHPNEEEFQIFEDSVVKAITGLDPKGKSKLWTTLAAQVRELILKATGDSDGLTFAEGVGLVEDAYQLYLKDKAENP